MKKFQTRYFGEIEYDPAKAIAFEQGIFGFPDSSQYLLMCENADEELFYWLQSLQEADVAFTLMNVYKVLPDYDPKIDEEQLDGLGDIAGQNLDILNIVVIPEDAKQMRVNLKSPLVINNGTGMGVQVICANEEYPIRYHIFEEFERARKLTEEGASC